MLRTSCLTEVAHFSSVALWAVKLNAPVYVVPKWKIWAPAEFCRVL
jgi:hypothetical protein